MNKYDEDIHPVRLRLELVSDGLTSDEKVMLKRYGESSSGQSIVREIMIPSDMSLHALHYAIQKLFGWQNSHLRQFYLPDAVYKKLTKRTVKGWSELVGVLFQPPSEAERDLFWDDDYESGSMAVWLRKKYTGPYPYYGHYEQYDAARQDIEAMLNRFKEVEIQEPFSDYLDRKKSEPDAEPKILGTASLIDMTLDEMNEAIMLEGGTESLMESLLVTAVLAHEDEDTRGPGYPVTKELYYEYDFGDSWKVKITKVVGGADLLADHLILPENWEEACNTVIEKHKPVCLVRDGLSVMDDVGGLSGFANFLREIYEGENKQEMADHRNWARHMGWNQKKLVPRKVL